MKKISKLVLTGLIALSSSAANATTSGIQDAWRFDTSGAGIPSTTINIGHLNLSGGVGTVNQSFGADHILNAGDTFTEFGEIFTISVTKENCVGACDAGFPNAFGSPLTGLALYFTGLTGFVTNVDAQGSVTYQFNPGVGNIALKGTTDGTNFTQLANLSLVSPSGGSLGAFLGGLLPNGTTDLLSQIQVPDYVSNLFRDSTGTSLDSYVNDGKLFAAIHTQNTLGQPADCVTNGTGDAVSCTLVINSDGSLNLMTVPEPGIIALFGAGLMAFVGFNRRRSMKF